METTPGIDWTGDVALAATLMAVMVVGPVVDVTFVAGQLVGSDDVTVVVDSEVNETPNGLGLVTVNCKAPEPPGNRSAVGDRAAVMVSDSELVALSEPCPVPRTVQKP